MVRFPARIKKFDRQGEKTGWTYIEIPSAIAQQLFPGNRKSFRVKGKLDRFAIKSVALLPMGGGNFILPLNAGMRKGTGKRKGEMLEVSLVLDDLAPEINPYFLECLRDEPDALSFFESFTRSHRNYFSKWIDQAKTEATRDKRITQAIIALSRKLNFSQMLHSLKKDF